MTSTLFYLFPDRFAYVGAFLSGTFWSFVFAAIVMLIVMYLVDQFSVSSWWILGTGVSAVALMMLIPHGYRLELMLSSHPSFEAMFEGFSEDRLKTLVEYRFWGGLVGCIVGMGGGSYWFGPGGR